MIHKKKGTTQLIHEVGVAPRHQCLLSNIYEVSSGAQPQRCGGDIQGVSRWWGHVRGPHAYRHLTGACLAMGGSGSTPGWLSREIPGMGVGE